MKQLIVTAVVAMLVPTLAFAQQQITLEQTEQIQTIERMAGNNAIALKEQRIAALVAEIERLKKEVASCKPEAKAVPKDDNKK